MSAELATIVDGETVARVLLHGDLQRLTASQKVAYYHAVCESVGLNPLTQPFQYLVLNGREILYARREATEQLRRIHDVSITIAARELVDEIYVVTARATLPSGRVDENIGAVTVAGLKGESKANAMMKSETKAKRRVTLAICGLGMLDETEVADLPPQALMPPPGAENLRGPVEALPPDALPPALAPDPGRTDGAMFIERVDGTSTKNPKVIRYVITLSTGETASTINSLKASLAEQYRDARTPVRVTMESTRWGNDLKTIIAADAPVLAFEPPPPDEDQPF